MKILNSSDKLCIKLSEAILTAEPLIDFAYYQHKSATSPIDLGDTKSTNGTSEVELIGNPPATYNYNVKYINIINKDSIAHTFELIIYRGATGYTEKINLKPNETWAYPVKTKDIEIISSSRAWTYIAYAEDGAGTGFNLTRQSDSKYWQTIYSATELLPPTVSDFSGTWYRLFNNEFSYSDMLSWFDYTMPHDGLCNSATSTNGGTIDNILKNGVIQALPFSFVAGDKLRIVRAIGSLQPITTIEGVFADTTSSFTSPNNQSIRDQAWIVQEMLDYIVYVTWTNNHGCYWYIHTMQIITENKNTGEIKTYTYSASNTPYQINSWSYSPTDGYLILKLGSASTIGLKIDESGVLSSVSLPACPMLYQNQFATFFLEGATRKFMICYNRARTYIYNATTLAYITYFDITDYSDLAKGTWANSGDYIYFGGCYNTNIFKIRISTRTLSATIAAGSQVEMLHSDDISGKIWFTRSSGIGYLDISDDTIHITNLGVTVFRMVSPDSFGGYGASEFNCIDVDNGLIYAGECGGTRLVIFDINAETFTVTDITALTGGYLIHTINMVQGRPVVSCYSNDTYKQRKLITL